MSKRDKSRAVERLEREVTQLGLVTAGKLNHAHRQPRLGEVGALGSIGDGAKGSLESVAFTTSIDGGVAGGEKSRMLAKRRLLQEVLQPATISPRGGPSSRKTTGRHGAISTNRSQLSGAVSAPLLGGADETSDGYDGYASALQTPAPTGRAQSLAPIVGGGANQSSMFLSKLSQADVAISVKRSRSKVLPAVQDASSHSPASFMAEITAFVEGEITQLERRFPKNNSDLQTRVPPTSLLPSEIALRRAGCAPPTHEESKRALRVGIFSNAQKMFADSFKTYKLFLDAIAEEHATYANFLRDDLQLHKEVIAGMREEIERVKEQAKVDVAKAVADRDEVLALVDGERLKHMKLRMQHQEAQMKEKSMETDVKKQMLDLEQSNATLNQEAKRNRSEIEALTRQVDTLTLSTFSDALETANHALNEWKAAAASKDDAIFLAHDEIAELAKDLRRVTEHFHTLLDYDQHLQVEDVKLSPTGLRTLFPEAAAAARRTKQQDAKKEQKAVQEQRAADIEKSREADEKAAKEKEQGSSGLSPHKKAVSKKKDAEATTPATSPKGSKKGAAHSLANFLPPA